MLAKLQISHAGRKNQREEEREVGEGVEVFVVDQPVVERVVGC